MNLLEKHKDLKIEIHAEIKKKHEYGQIGRLKKRPGLRLYGYNPDEQKVYEVFIETEKTIDLKKDLASTHKSIVNPKHKMLWALNLKNAIRKFNNSFKQ
jgi:hypothetical protein